MKAPFVRDLKPNETITGVFLVQSKEVRQKKTGEPYLSLQLSDRTGDLDAKMWDNVAEAMDTFERDDFVKVRGLYQLYNGRPQFTVHKIRSVEDSEVEFADFFPASERDAEEMWAELQGIVARTSNPHLRALLEAFLDDPELATAYKIAPAAKSIHHAFRGGLLEHVLSVSALGRLVAGHYKMIDQDLLTTGIILHDIGKIRELSYGRGTSYTAEGQLVGHIAIAVRMLSEKLRNLPEFPEELRNLVEHLILSHHGKLEFGSPKTPIFPEALVLHYLDDMDSKMENMRALIEKDAQTGGLFTPYSQSLERVVLRKQLYLDPQARPPATASGHGAKPADSVPTQKQAPSTNSIFGERLRAAIQEDRKPE